MKSLISFLLMALLGFSSLTYAVEKSFQLSVNLNSHQAVLDKIKTIEQKRVKAAKDMQRRLKQFKTSSVRYYKEVADLCRGIIPGRSYLEGYWQGQLYKGKNIQIRIRNSTISVAKIKSSQHTNLGKIQNYSRMYYFICRDKQNREFIVLERDANEPYWLNGEVLLIDYDATKNQLALTQVDKDFQPITKKKVILHRIQKVSQ